MEYIEQIEHLLSNPSLLIKKKPFTRGLERSSGYDWGSDDVEIGQLLDAYIPTTRKRTITQEQYQRELDPFAHDVLFDDNIPAICVKLKDGNYHEMKFEKVALPIQRVIKNKQVMHLSANPMQFTLIDTNPTDAQSQDFITFKQYWAKRNQDGMKTKMVDTQLSYGDAGLLYYFDYKGRIKSRILSFSDGYVLCPHNDQNGDRILESVYYTKDGVEYIDSYDDTYMHRWVRDNAASTDDTGWRREQPIAHGFDEIPLITKRGEVAWNNVQTAIEGYELLYNIYLVVFKRFGYGIFYVKGRFKDNAQKIAGSIVLNDTSIDGKGDAKFLTPPAPEGIIDTLDTMIQNIQLGSSTTFLLPKDIKTGGDIAGITIQLVQSLDIENALQKVIEWQNVADKMVRLFKQGLAKELVNSGIHKTAVTSFEDLHINAKFKVWQPRNDYEYNQMIATLHGAGILSNETSIELNTLSKPDEKARVARENEETRRIEAEAQMRSMQVVQQTPKEEEGEEDTDGN